ncbi:MAG: TerB family tellurite resistance protein [Flavobacteriales bacterium]|nr:TerB family tellurite resistance protein [Flavobacteriales bacterium]
MKFNKDITGFQLLSILSQVDGEFSPVEGSVIIDYIRKNFPLGGNLDAATDEISKLQPDKYMELFEIRANDFLEESTEKERLDFLKFAMKLINADEKLAREEDTFISKLYSWWGIG